MLTHFPPGIAFSDEILLLTFDWIFLGITLEKNSTHYYWISAQVGGRNQAWQFTGEEKSEVKMLNAEQKNLGWAIEQGAIGLYYPWTRDLMSLSFLIYRMGLMFTQQSPAMKSKIILFLWNFIRTHIEITYEKYFPHTWHLVGTQKTVFYLCNDPGWQILVNLF